MRLDDGRFTNLPFCSNQIVDKYVTQNDLDYLCKSYLDGNIPIDTYNFLTIRNNADVVGLKSGVSIFQQNIHTQTGKFLRAWLHSNRTCDVSIDVSCNNSKSWSNTRLQARDFLNDPITVYGEQLFMFVGKSRKQLSGGFPLFRPGRPSFTLMLLLVSALMFVLQKTGNFALFGHHTQYLGADKEKM